ncbi:hypothetical protein SLA2020_183230 [Shorea laevis]
MTSLGQQDLRLAHAVDVAGFCFCEGIDFLELWGKIGGVAQDVFDCHEEGEPGVYHPNHSVVVRGKVGEKWAAFVLKG